MASRNAPARQPETGDTPPANPLITDWMNAVMVILTGISGIGLLVATVGLYLLKSDLLLLVGVCVVTAAGAGWAVAAVLLIYHIIRLRFSGSGKAHKASLP